MFIDRLEADMQVTYIDVNEFQYLVIENHRPLAWNLSHDENVVANWKL